MCLGRRRKDFRSSRNRNLRYRSFRLIIRIIETRKNLIKIGGGFVTIK